VEIGERSIELRHIVPGMPVRDADGEKIGTVAHLHQRVGAGGPASDAVANTILEIKTGLLGRGERLYVPFGAVGRLSQTSLFLTSSRRAIADQHPEWRTRPADLPAEGSTADRSRPHARPDDWYRLFT
jgi:hypothetical protein